MYNLLVGLTHGMVGVDRLLEYTSPEIRQYLSPADEVRRNEVRIDRLLNLPTLLMPEIEDSEEPQVARVGHVTNMVRSAYGYTFTFVPNPAIVPISMEKIESAAAFFDIGRWELRRTHWAVKDVDLYRILDQENSTRVVPKVFQLPISEPPEPDLVAVMMPFSASFDAVYESLKVGVEAAAMRCLRADDIWKEDRILDDVLSLIWRARVVIADLSSKNPNVLYEAGIAHTLGRDTILIAQAMNDIPFDLRAIRALNYLNNGEGRKELAQNIARRLSTIIS